VAGADQAPATGAALSQQDGPGSLCYEFRALLAADQTRQEWLTGLAIALLSEGEDVAG